MDKEMNGIHPTFQRWLILLPVILVILACSLTQSPGTQTSPVPQGSNSDTPQTTPAGLDPLQRLLEMRSIQFNLTALQPNGTARSVQAEIDSSGNMHLKFLDSVSLPPDLAQQFSTPLQSPEESELYVVAGKTYRPDDQDPAWMITPLAEDAVAVVSNLLHGPNGPGLWLDILPASSLQSAGRETVGGFAADKFIVNGTVHGQKITGSLWYESHTLVQIELHIPASLLDPTQPAAQGELKITLEAQKADIQPVILPTPPAEAVTPTSQTQTNQGSADTPQPAGVYISQAGLPPGFPIYPGAHGFSGVQGFMVKYSADADVGTASEFYDKAMKANGWSGISTGGVVGGECGGDCGGNALPTSTPGPTPTATPPGWMDQNTQMWTSGTSQIMIVYTANAGGGTDIIITVTAK